LVVVDVDERFARALRDLSGQVGDEVVAVEVNLVSHVADLVALEQLLFQYATYNNPRSSPLSLRFDLSLPGLPGFQLSGLQSFHLT
jgi:hypothetical protein